ncbi:MAG TPA: hypothetical protein VET51_04345 [Burkholderiales bacterium]|nr:hypothetical protein [Burkholderiales bacterium]
MSTSENEVVEERFIACPYRNGPAAYRRFMGPDTRLEDFYRPVARRRWDGAAAVGLVVTLSLVAWLVL